MNEKYIRTKLYKASKIHGVNPEYLRMAKRIGEYPEKGKELIAKLYSGELKDIRKVYYELYPPKTKVEPYIKGLRALTNTLKNNNLYLNEVTVYKLIDILSNPNSYESIDTINCAKATDENNQ